MTGRAVLVLVLAAGCTGDPSVVVRFEVPPDYRDLVDAVALEVLASEDIDCDAVALGNASAEQLAEARVAEALLRDGGDGAPLSGIPRTGRKLFVARALGGGDQLVAAGCAEAGTIDGDVEVVIDGEPALTLGARDTPSSGPLPTELTVLVSDARGQPVQGARGWQTVYAAAGIELPGPEATSGRGGALRFMVAPATWAGPQVLDVDVRWQANERDLFSGFVTPFPRGSSSVPSGGEAESLPTRALYQVGRIGAGGEMGVAVLGRADEATGQRRVHIFTYDPDGDTFSRVTSVDSIPVAAIGLIEDDTGDVVVAMNADSWFRVQPSGVIEESGGEGLIDAVALATIGDCVPDHPRGQVLAVSATGEVGIYDAGGGRVADWAGARPTGVRDLFAAGCVRGLGAEVFRAAVYSVSDGERPMLALDSAGTEPTPVNSAIDRGFAFTPLIAGGEGPYLLANRFENDGTSIARYSVVPVDGAPTFLDERDEDEIAGFAATTVGGDFDGDGLLDVAAMTTVPTGDGRIEFRFYMSLGIVVEEQRLFGLDGTEIPSVGFSPLLLTADFDGDQYDDLVLATPAQFNVFELEPE